MYSMGFSPGAPPRRIAALFFVACGAALFLTGCAGKPVASVNGQALSEPDFARMCETAVSAQFQQGGGTVGTQVLMEWIRNTVLSQEAKRQNLYPSEKDLEARLDAWRKQTAFT